MAPIPVLFGHTLSGKPLTLLDSISAHVEANPFAGHSRELLTSNRLIHGAHLADITELEVRDAVIGIQGLREWSLAPWHYGGESEAESHPFAGDAFSASLEGGNMILQRSIATSHDQRRQQAAVTARFELDPPLPYPEFSERFAGPLRDLIVLAAHVDSEITAMNVLVPSTHVKWWADSRPVASVDDVRVIERTTLDFQAPRERAFEKVPMPLASWGGDAGEVLNRWFVLREELGGPGNLLFATFNKRFTHLENDLLSLLSVAEGYHRSRFDRAPFKAEAHGTAVKAMLASLSDERQVEHYRNKLRFANEQSQRQRVRELFDRAASSLGLAAAWRKRHLQGLIDTRNFLTHWGQRGDDVLEDWDLWLALNRLRIVLEVNLFLDLKIDSDTITAAIANSYSREILGVGRER